MEDADILAFVGATVKSVWALELLLLMRHERCRAWHVPQLVRELRASTLVVAEALKGLQSTGLVATDETGEWCYRPASEQLDAFVEGAESLYAAKPVAVINAIATAPSEKLRIFAEAFRLKD
ncbi:MAG TPA: hypothetical protein VGM17_01935 [Rhizomicrobium sp.]